MTMTEVIHSVTTLMSVCTKHVSRAAKKLRDHSTISASKLAAAAAPVRRKTMPLIARGASYLPFFKHKQNRKKIRSPQEEEKEVEEEYGGGGVWRRSILMGEKCQPLDFSGVIYYDNNGKQLSEIPTPRSPLRSPLPSFAFHPVVATS
ncbi:uncharacterized protein LOC120251698 [Dioscorea cayenensis subsp. rotundata]|uniref:Uncharacterized protein LOC120251698 n=1 Tax=Dioscorea cayennensis subsp. rotundata TaxID=55577 RepID=A0AB40AMM8_DIOCR|nr:uncharacterized protein LOC120251698 [Dioscorea cayenensis subsp. rotundata]